MSGGRRKLTTKIRRHNPCFINYSQIKSGISNKLHRLLIQESGLQLMYSVDGILGI